MMLFEYLPVYYQQVGASIDLVPLLLAAGSGITVFLFWWMHKVEQQLIRYRFYILLAATIAFIALSLLGVWGAVIGIFIFTRIMRVLIVNNETVMQHHAPEAARATIGSLYSFSAKLLSAGIITAIGFLAVENSIVAPLRWVVIAGIAVLLVLAILFATRRQLPGPTTVTS